MRTCVVCGRTSDVTTVVVDHRDEFVAPNGELVPVRDTEICLDDYHAKTGQDWQGAIPEDS